MSYDFKLVPPANSRMQETQLKMARSWLDKQPGVSGVFPSYVFEADGAWMGINFEVDQFITCNIPYAFWKPADDALTTIYVELCLALAHQGNLELLDLQLDKKVDRVDHIRHRRQSITACDLVHMLWDGNMLYVGSYYGMLAVNLAGDCPEVERVQADAAFLFFWTKDKCLLERCMSL